jgi:membrane-associated protease RseP (regulator of RpoE activity)
MNEQTDFAPEAPKSKNGLRPWIGVHLGVANSLQQEYGKQYGPSVLKVMQFSPAARAGLEANDVLLSINGTRVDSPEDFLHCLRTHSVGTTISILVRRGDVEQVVEVEIGSDSHILGVPDYYALLEVSPDASVEVIKEAFLVQSKKFDPANVETGDPYKLKLVRDAWDTLHRVESRERYDIWLAEQKLITEGNSKLLDES